MATPNLQRIQVIKQESGALGGNEADNFPFDAPIHPREDAVEAAGVYLQDLDNRDQEVLVTRSGDNMMFYDITVGSGVSLLQLLEGESAGTGMTPNQHKSLRQLIHFVDEGPAAGFTSGAFKEILPAGSPFPTSVIWWESAAKTQKIVEKTITRTGGGATNVKPTPIEWKMYDTDGVTVLNTVSDSIVYNGQFEYTRTRTIVV